MHPQIKQDGIGNCPICGMNLEPQTVVTDDHFDEESFNLKNVSG